VAIAMALLIATGLPLFVWMTSGRWELLALAAVLTPLCYLPNLAVTGDWPAFRTQAAIESLMAFYALLSMQAWWWLGCRVLLAPSGLGARPWLSSRLMAVLAGSSVLAAGYFVTVYFVVPQTIEYRLAQSLLKDAKLSGGSRVELIGADWSDTAAPAVYFEEFGQPSSYRPWGGVPMIHLLLAERHPAYRDMPVDFVTPGTGDLPSAAGSIIMDMRQLRTFRNVVGE
jgi:hypothetical protein